MSTKLCLGLDVCLNKLRIYIELILIVDSDQFGNAEFVFKPILLAS